MARIDHVVCTSPLEAAVIEIRLIHEHLPRFNRHGTNWSRYAYIKLSLGERFPRLSAARVVADDGGLYLGPVSSVGFARRAIEAVESVVPLRRCTLRPGSTPQTHPCAPAQLGVATCPCSGQVDETSYATLVEHVAQGLTNQPGLLLQPLEKRMHRLAAQERFEEAATVRERARILTGCLLRQRRFDLLRRSGAVRVRTRNYGGADLVDGRLERTWTELPVDDPPSRQGQGPGVPDDCPPGPVPKEDADELNCVAVWFDRQAHRLRLLHCDGTLIEPIAPLPDFEPRREGTTD
jgi:DNA polymerase-3 subunit epsilon